MVRYPVTQAKVSIFFMKSIYVHDFLVKEFIPQNIVNRIRLINLYFFIYLQLSRFRLFLIDFLDLEHCIMGVTEINIVSTR